MPAEFQRVMDTNLLEYPQAHAFIDDILVVTKTIGKPTTLYAGETSKEAKQGKYVVRVNKV